MTLKPLITSSRGCLLPCHPQGVGSLPVRLRSNSERRNSNVSNSKSPRWLTVSGAKAPAPESQKGRIKRAMFQKLRTNRYMKTSGRENGAVVEFTGKVQRIARVHQYGLKDRPNPNAKVMQYPERQLLGFCKEDLSAIENFILKKIDEV